MADSEDNVKDAKTSGTNGPDDQEPSPEGFEAPSKRKRDNPAFPPTVELRGSSWTPPPRIQTTSSNPLAYPFKLPEEVRERVRAEMLRADADFEDEEKSAYLQPDQREDLAIRWICRILGVFAQEACRLASSRDPDWRASQIEKRVDEVFQLLVWEAENSKFGSGRKPSLTQGGYVRKSTEVKIKRSPEWSQYIQAIQSLLDRRVSSGGAEPSETEGVPDPAPPARDDHKEANYAKALPNIGDRSSEVEPRKPPLSAAADVESGIPPSPGRGPEEGGAESVLERSKRRSAVVTPILASKRWTRGRWATKAGVGKNSVYEYLNGKRNLSFENRQALAEVLGLKPEELPD